MILRRIQPRTGRKPQLHWLIADCLGLMTPARGDGCLGKMSRSLGTLKGPRTVPNVFNAATPVTKTFIVWIDAVRHSLLHLLAAEWLRLMEPVRDESSPAGQRRRLAAAREGRFPSQQPKQIQTSTNPTVRRRERQLADRHCSERTMWKPQPHSLISDWPGCVKQP